MRSGLVATSQIAGTTRGWRRVTRSLRRSVALIVTLVAACASVALAQTQKFSAPAVTTFPAGGGSNAAVSVTVNVTVLVPTAISGFTVPLGFQNSPEFLFTGQDGCTVDGTTVMQAGAVCMVSLRFFPLGPGQRFGTLVVTDGNGVPTTFGLSGIGYYSQVAVTPGAAKIAAGTGPDTAFTGISTGDGDVATAATLSGVHSVAADSFGNIYIADPGNNRVRMLDAFGNITTVAGGGQLVGSAADGLSATSAKLNGPMWVAVDAAGNLYISETGNNVIRKVAMTSDRTITTFVGNYSAGFSNGTSATTASLNSPQAIVFDNTGNLIFADAGNHIVRIVDATSGQVSTLAGTGDPSTDIFPAPVAALSAHFTTPIGLAIDSQNNLYISDFVGDVRKLSNGIVTTFAGSGQLGHDGDGGPATNANFTAPAGLALTPAGDLYIADNGSDTIRKVEASTGNIETIVGIAEVAGFSPGVSVTTETMLNAPVGIALDAYQNLYIADSGNSVVRLISTAPGELDFPSQTLGNSPAPATVKVANIGDAPLTVNNVATANSTTSSNFTFDNTGPLPCASTVAAGAHCAFTVAFAPQTSGFIPGEIDVADNAGLTSLYPKLQPIYLLGGSETALAIGPRTLPQAVANHAYTQTAVSATGGYGTVTLDLGGSLPAGMTSTISGQTITFAGTPTVAGSYPITVYASDTLGETAIQLYTITVLPQTVTFTWNEAVHVTDTQTELNQLSLNLNEIVTIQDALIANPSLALNVSEAVHITDGEVLPYILTVTESIHSADTVGDLAGLVLTVNEALGVADQVTPLSGLVLTVPEAIGVADHIQPLSGLVLTVTEAITTTDAPQTAVTGKRSQTITAPTIPAHTYGDLPFSVAATASSGLPVSVGLSSGHATLNNGTLDITGTGSITLIYSQAGDANTLAAPPVSITFNAAPAVATIRALDAVRVAGQANPAFSYTLSGLVHGDAATVVTGLPTLTTTANTNTQSGTYPITPAIGTLSATNYTFNFVPGTLTVVIHVVRSTIFLVGSGGVSSLTDNGNAQSTAISAGGTGAAVDANGYVWSIDNSGTSIAQFNSSGGLTADYSGVGLSGASALAIDGNGQVWVANGDHTVSVLSNSGTPVSKTTDARISGVTGIAIDSSGNVWLSSGANDTVQEIIGGAAPAAPIATAITNNTTGRKP
jgi:sugar lactone lactonase YvrE